MLGGWLLKLIRAARLERAYLLKSDLARSGSEGPGRVTPRLLSERSVRPLPHFRRPKAAIPLPANFGRSAWAPQRQVLALLRLGNVEAKVAVNPEQALVPPGLAS